jgi:3-dehydro-L-gulonate 2-dehydrogenase
MAQLLNEAIDDLHTTTPAEPGSRIRYPGEGALHARQQSQELGIPVDEEIWTEILDLKNLLL